jgi:hypothetical protein
LWPIFDALPALGCARNRTHFTCTMSRHAQRMQAALALVMQGTRCNTAHEQKNGGCVTLRHK